MGRGGQFAATGGQAACAAGKRTFTWRLSCTALANSCRLRGGDAGEAARAAGSSDCAGVPGSDSPRLRFRGVRSSAAARLHARCGRSVMSLGRKSGAL